MRLYSVGPVVVSIVLTLVVAAPARAQDPATQAGSIGNELSRLQSRIDAPAAPPIRRYLAERDRRIANQQLQSLKTRSPGERAIPVLERRMDRLSRPGRSIRRR